MRIARNLFMLLALLTGFAVIGSERAWLEPIAATALNAESDGAGHPYLLGSTNCHAAASHADHQCACSGCRPVAACSSPSEFRRPTLSIADTLQEIALVVPLDERALPTSRERLARTARWLL